MSKPTAAWKAFERFVAQIEAVLAPLGATVASPDRVLDHISGSMREVDAAIRYAVGKSTVLITVECRDRQKVEDTMWIEQLVTKQRSIGAARTIAVTSRKFSEPALRKAAHFGIDTRVIQDVRPEEIGALLNIRYHESCFHSILRHLHITLYGEQGEAETPPFTPEVLAQLKANASDARVFRLRNGEKASWNDQYKLAQKLHHDALYEPVPRDGSSCLRKLKLDMSDDLFVDTIRGERRVQSFDSVVEIYVRQTSSEMTIGRVADYLNTSGPLARAAAYTVAASFGSLNVVAVAPTDGQAYLSLEVQPKRDA